MVSHTSPPPSNTPVSRGTDLTGTRGDKAKSSGSPGRSWLGLHLALLKVRIILLLELAAISAILVHDLLHPHGSWTTTATTLLIVTVGGFLAAGGANALNMWYERDSDALMERTRSRPLPTRKMTPRHVLGLGLVTSLMGVATIWSLANWTAGLVTAFSVCFYVLVYTILLKRRTGQNIVIGGAAGATPPLIGWLAAGGELLTPLPWLMFLLIWLWTPPHFWALALNVQDDYRKAGIPMLPQIKGEAATHRHIAAYSLGLVVLPPLFCSSGSGYHVLVIGTLLNLLLLRLVWQLFRQTGIQAPRRLFAGSLLYLLAFMALLVLDALLQNTNG